ncbi:MAG TPA: GGDEF domain-containing protein [Pseudolabrys sp.]|nr:GGDEF domain-containing protein [Pseudolabrys sp.]
MVDESGGIVHVNRKWCTTARIGGLVARIEGWNYIEECEAAIARGCAEAIPILEGLRQVLDGQLPSFVATYTCPFAGRHHWFEVVMSTADFGGARHAVLMHVDVSAMQVDSLTRLPNRATFDAQLALSVSSARDLRCQTGVVLVDMNHLKSINDMYGHQIGDAALKALAGELSAQAGPDCLVCRIGGDEFGVVLPVNHDTLTAHRILARIGARLAASVGSADHTIIAAASAGIALYPDDGETPEALYQAADRSMYAQKRGSSVA